MVKNIVVKRIEDTEQFLHNAEYIISDIMKESEYTENVEKIHVEIMNALNALKRP